MIGLIVKGSTALFMQGADPGSEGAVGLINRYRLGNSRSWEAKLSALNMEHVVRPIPLLRESLAWAYVFLTHTERDDHRLEPGPLCSISR